MKAASWNQIDGYWAHELGLDSSPAELPPVTCSVHSGSRGVQLFRGRTGVVIASPPQSLDRARDAIARLSPDEIFSTGWAERVFGNDAERILGPAAIHYADESSFRSTTGTNARALSATDARSYRAFVNAIAPDDLDESGIPAELIRVYGAFAGDTLYGVASYEDWRSVIAQIGVVTDPAHRRRGFAKASISALARDALSEGLVLQWRARTSNHASLAVARGMGFEYYASTIFVRLREG